MRDSNTNRYTLIANEKGYVIDDQGRVVSPQGRYRKEDTAPNGYQRFSIKVEKGSRKTVNVFVHKLGAFQKFGASALIEGVEIRHLDGNACNNQLSNLAIGTPSENQLDRHPTDRLEHARRAASFNRALTRDEAEQLRRDRHRGLTFKQLAKKYEVAVGTAHGIVSRRFYTE